MLHQADRIRLPESKETLYTNSVDFLYEIPLAAQNFVIESNGANFPEIWIKVVSTYPMEYLTHRAKAMAELLNTGNIYACLPIHVGIDGNKDYLEAAGIARGTSYRAALIYDAAKSLFNTPIWRNWFYLLIASATVAWVIFKRTIQNRSTVLVYLAALLLFIGAFIPTSIACDFRYLYPVIPTLTGILLFLISSSGSIEENQEPT